MFLMLFAIYILNILKKSTMIISIVSSTCWKKIVKFYHCFLQKINIQDAPIKLHPKQLHHVFVRKGSYSHWLMYKLTASH